MSKRISLSILAALVAFFSLPTLASAHVTVSPEEAAADGYAMLQFTVPHGCDGAATTGLVVKMPDQVISATPGVVPGWDVETTEGKLPKPAEQHGEQITSGVRQVAWTGGNLPDDRLQQFALSVAFQGEPGETAAFKVIQQCAGGKETAWIEMPSADGPEAEHPAPAVTLTAAEDTHADTASASSGSDDSGSGDGLAIIALIIGILGLAAGTAALIRSEARR